MSAPAATTSRNAPATDPGSRAMRAPADAERASVGHRETFDVDAFATACASALGFDADAVEDAVEILMECAPTLVEKNVVAVDASFVRPRPRVPIIHFALFF
jgi:hypothetical protein